MTKPDRTWIWGLLMLSGFVLFPQSTQAQMSMGGGGRSLGGYGASAIGSYYSSGSSGYLPYNGNGSGFIPSGAGLGLGSTAAPVARRLPESSIGGTLMANTPIGGASFPAGMGAGSRTSTSMRTSSPDRSFVPFGYEGGIGMSAAPMSTQPRVPAGPGFGYPFRMPASLSGSGAGMAGP